VDFVLHLSRRQGSRVVEELLPVGRYDGRTDRYAADVVGRVERAPASD
jgi:hypothetical protein